MSSRYPAPRLAARARGPALALGYGDIKGLPTLTRIAVATLLGLLVAAGRLSTNPLARALAAGYVELIRNTPLLLQLFVWYFAVLLKLPPWESALSWGEVILSQRGLALLQVGLGGGALGLALGLLAWFPLRRRPLWAWGALALGLLMGWVLFGPPLVLSALEKGAFGARGGLLLSPEFAALLFGLIVYTAAFIAEVFRGAILAVPKGQWEAAFSLGLTPFQAVRYVILPQALRAVVPALVGQYIALFKDTSLVALIGLLDLMGMARAVLANPQNVGLEREVYLFLALVYLLVSGSFSYLGRLLERGLGLGVRWNPSSRSTTCTSGLAPCTS